MFDKYQYFLNIFTCGAHTSDVYIRQFPSLRVGIHILTEQWFSFTMMLVG